HHRADVRSSTGSERAAPRRGYFFFFAATLRLAGAFFFAAVFAFVAFFTILPSWPKPSGGVASAPSRNAGPSFPFIQTGKKKKSLKQPKLRGGSLPPPPPRPASAPS